MNEFPAVTGAKVLFEIPGLGGLHITETVLNTWIVMAVIVGLCLFLTHGMQVHGRTKRQIIAEFIVQKVNGMVKENTAYTGYEVDGGEGVERAVNNKMNSIIKGMIAEDGETAYI